MRESKKIEKTHLPQSSYEAWSEAQSPKAGEAKHKNPPEDLYEAWVRKRVAGKVQRETPVAKKTRKKAT